MPNKNIFQQRIRPVLPRILQAERVFVYVPKASSNSAGTAYFPDDEFTVAADGKVTLKWPMSLQIENNKINDPTKTMTRVKVNDDEFVKTGEQVVITHPTTNKSYSNTTSAIKFKRTGQDLFNKPGFMMVNNIDFEKEEIDSGDTQDPGRYVKYKLKRNNPLEQASLVKLNNQDFAYNGEATIRWPYAHNPASGTDRTDNYGLVKIKPDSAGYLRFDNGYLEIDINALKENADIDSEIVPLYGGIGDGFEDFADYVDIDGFAKRDVNNNILLKLTKDAVGLSKVQNKAFLEYIYSDFGPEMQQYFTNEFNKKVNVTEWNKLFIDWQEPAGSTVQKIITNLREEDEAIRDAMRTNRSFLGFFEDNIDLENTYTAGEWTLGSTAYIRATKSYWKVRPNNVNAIVEDRVPVKADVPGELLNTTTYKVGRRDTKQVYRWTGSTFVLTNEPLRWVDIVIANEEDIQPYIHGHASSHFVTGFRIGCRETNVVIEYDGASWVSGGAMYYEWADTYITTLLWNSFIETDVTALKPNGVANLGTSGKWVSSDHVHPTDTSRLSKDVFDNTSINIESIFTNNSETDFNISLANGGDKQLNIPYVRVAQAIHNWKGQTNFVDSVESEEYYWSGTQEEFNTDEEYIKNKSLIVIDDDEQVLPAELLQLDDLNKFGITINNASNERFVIVNTTNLENIISTPLTIRESKTADNQSRYNVTNLIPQGTNSGKLIITKKLSDTATTLDMYESTNMEQATLLGFTPDGILTQFPEEFYINAINRLSSGKILVSDDNYRNVKSLNTIDNIEGGIIVADGTGAIKSTSFTSPGKLLQTSGNNGETLSAEIDVNTLVRANAEEFNDMGIVVSTATGEIERQDLGLLENKLIVSDGAHGLKVQDIENESLVYIDNTGKVKAFPTTTNDYGKVLMVQNNGKIAIQSLPAQPTHLPVTTLGSVSAGTKLSFGQTSTFEEGVLYLW